MKPLACRKLGAGVSLVLLCVACDQAHKQDQPAAQLPEAGVELPTELGVDPMLISSGRITLEVVRRAAPGGGARIAGEVVSSPEGAAEVGVLSSGRISGIEVNVGDAVTQGQTLAWVESPLVGGARAALARSLAAREFQKSRAARQEQLEKEGATSQSSLDEARAATRVAEADYTSAVLQLSSLGANAGSGSRYSLVAPIAGVIAESTAVLGSAVRAEQLLFRVIAPEKVLILARFPEGRGNVPEAGTKVRIVPRGASSQTECEAVVETNARVVDPHTRTILVRLRPVKNCTPLRPGAYVEVAPPQGGGSDAAADQNTATVTNSNADDVQVPSEAVVYVRGEATVFVADKETGKFHARAVQLTSVDGALTTLNEGVKVGEQVVSRGTILLKGEMLREVLGGE